MLERWDGETAGVDPDGSGRGRTRSCVRVVSRFVALDGADRRRRVGERC